MPLASLSAPYPATSSSSFLQVNIGMFRSAFGYAIHAKQTDWIHDLPLGTNHRIDAMYKAPQIPDHGIQAALTVRSDRLQTDMSLVSYMKQWTKDYPRLGLDVIRSGKVKVNDQIAFLVDLADRNSAKRIQQIVFIKDRKVVILSCRDHQQTFNVALKACHQLARNFSWL